MSRENLKPNRRPLKRAILRNPLRTRKHILDVAFMEVYRHGFKGTSTNAIIEKMKMTRGAFFHHFPTKDDLAYALIDDVLREMILERWIRPAQALREDPLKGIIRNFSRLIEEHEDRHLLCGCPLNNLVQELADKPEFQRRIQAVMELWISETQALLTKAKKSGHLKSEVDTRELAEFIVACQESAFAMSKALNSRHVMFTILKSLKTYLTRLKN